MALRTTEDDNLIARIQGNDEQAFDQLFRKYYPGLFRYCKSLIPYPTDVAEEIVLDVFLKFWLQRRELNIHSSLSSLLYASVKNRALDHYRKTKAIIYQPIETVEETALASFMMPDQHLVFKELGNNIEYLISCLPERTQLVFRMNREDALPYQEIADLLNISVNSVKTHMYRALKFLKESFRNSAASEEY